MVPSDPTTRPLCRPSSSWARCLPFTASRAATGRSSSLPALIPPASRAPTRQGPRTVTDTRSAGRVALARLVHGRPGFDGSDRQQQNAGGPWVVRGREHVSRHWGGSPPLCPPSGGPRSCRSWSTRSPRHQPRPDRPPGPPRRPAGMPHARAHEHEHQGQQLAPEHPGSGTGSARSVGPGSGLDRIGGTFTPVRPCEARTRARTTAPRPPHEGTTGAPGQVTRSAHHRAPLAHLHELSDRHERTSSSASA